MTIQFKTEAGDIVTTHASRICAVARPATSLGRTMGKYAVWIEGFSIPIAVTEDQFNIIESKFHDYLQL